MCFCSSEPQGRLCTTTYSERFSAEVSAEATGADPAAVDRDDGKAAMDVPQELPGDIGNHYDHNVYYPARFVLVDPQDKDKLFNAETGKSPEIRRHEVESLRELQEMTGQDLSSSDQLP